MDISLTHRFVKEVFPLVQARFRYFHQRWWVSQDGFWTRESARYHLESDVYVLADQSRLPHYDKIQLRMNIGKQHVMNRILRELSPLLTTTRGLPARIEQDLTQAGLPFALLALKEPSGPVPMPAPGLPVAYPDQEPVDQADTASPDGHTP